MCNISIAPYMPFQRMKIINQQIFSGIDVSFIQMRPNRRFCPICHKCSSRGVSIHDWEERSIRDLNLGQMKVYLHCRYRKILCPTCQKVRIEDLDCFDPYQRVTKRFACYIHDLCKMMTITEVAEHLGLDWKTVKEIDQTFLEEDYGKPNLDGLRILAIDEIAIKKRHQYMTVILDYETGRVVWMTKDRTYESLSRFFKMMTKKQKNNLQAIAMDMWDPYIMAVAFHVPHVKIVFDLYHVVAAFNRVIDAVRNAEYRKASLSSQKIIRGSRYLLLMNKRNIRKKKARQHLNQLLKINTTLSKVYILKDKLKKLWNYSSRAWAEKALDNWCLLARTIHYKIVRQFTNRIERYAYGILNHCLFPINSAKLEGTNNKIKVIKRKAFGFHDTKYFMLKVIQAFDPLNGR